MSSLTIYRCAVWAFGIALSLAAGFIVAAPQTARGMVQGIAADVHHSAIVSSCPDNDGSGSPSTGTPQYASVAALKASGTYSAQINTGTNSLGCLVAGVDYHVGLSTAQTLLDPTLGGLPAGCAYASNKVTCSGNSITYQGWDHTLHNGIALSVAGSNNTITQNKLGGGGSNCSNPPVFLSAVGGTTTITYNTIIGNA